MMGEYTCHAPPHGGHWWGGVRCHGGTEATTATFLAFSTCCAWSPGGAGHLPGLSGHVPVKRALLGPLGRGPWVLSGRSETENLGTAGKESIPLQHSLPSSLPSLLLTPHSSTLP